MRVGARALLTLGISLRVPIAQLNWFRLMLEHLKWTQWGSPPSPKIG